MVPHQLREQGKNASAIKIYRKAIDLACRQDVLHEPARLVDGQEQLRRYKLPRELALDPVLRDLIYQGDARYGDWKLAMPEEPIAWLAAGRILEERSDAEANELFERTISLYNSRPKQRDARSIALDEAAAAEALALSGKPGEALSMYKRAIQDVDVELVRRAWSMNLADLALKTGDARAAKEAWESARGEELSDAIAHRSEELQLANLAARGPGSKTDAQNKIKPLSTDAPPVEVETTETQSIIKD